MKAAMRPLDPPWWCRGMVTWRLLWRIACRQPPESGVWCASRARPGAGSRDWRCGSALPARLSGCRGCSMFERYTEKSRRSIFFARYVAGQFGAAEVDTLHVLLGLLRENKSLARLFPDGTDLAKV